MTDTSARQRAEIRSLCHGIRRLLYSVRLRGSMSAEQEVGDIECSALAATKEELPAVRESVERIIRRLQETDAGNGEMLLSQERWKQFFGVK